ncbi:Tautomerase/MIF [Patellaria atrata CBS 101060]|uniref:L-dopachrome isomerase n=1 Tax=Patellaria atrata CBS 101060 TaxID=1346257 RepID=A0A9P4SKJ1_9PEZI|nr:Tautomerase/MIF [Patellaria atrata CBS 101060]
MLSSPNRSLSLKKLDEVYPTSLEEGAANTEQLPVPHSSYNGELLSPRTRLQYYEETLAYRKVPGHIRDTFAKQSPVVAQLSTNVILPDVFLVVRELSIQLSGLYNRSESSIMVTLKHSTCMILGGTFEPTYVLTMSALPSQIQPTINKRNAAVIQNFLQDVLGVQPNRGVIKFQAVEEANLAINGGTILGKIEEQEKIQSLNEGSLKRAFTKRSPKTPRKVKSLVSLSRKRADSTSNKDSPGIASIPEDRELSPIQTAEGEHDNDKSSASKVAKAFKRSISFRELMSSDSSVVTPQPDKPEEAADKSVRTKKSFKAAIFGK